MALDKIHKDIKVALEKEGWTIRAQPMRIATEEGIFLYVDMEAERIFLAERREERIAVEVKSFLGRSILYDFYSAFGQYLFYRDTLRDEGFQNEIYLAVPFEAFLKILNHPLIMKRINQYHIKFIVVDIETQNIEEWLK